MKYCNCKIQKAPIFKRIKGISYFVCYRCGQFRKMNKSEDRYCLTVRYNPHTGTWEYKDSLTYTEL